MVQREQGLLLCNGLHVFFEEADVGVVPVGAGNTVTFVGIDDKLFRRGNHVIAGEICVGRACCVLKSDCHKDGNIDQSGKILDIEV